MTRDGLVHLGGVLLARTVSADHVRALVLAGRLEPPAAGDRVPRGYLDAVDPDPVPELVSDEWLDPAHNDTTSLLGLLEPAAPGRLLAQPVSRLVSNVANNGPELVEPIALTGEESGHA